MKKSLLAAFALFIALAVNAQIPGTMKWTVKNSPATEAASLYRTAPLAVAADGSVFTTGTFDQPITIGKYALENVATSAYLAKYSATGEALWGISLSGAATITCIAVDADGQAYVAGVFADAVTVGSTDGNGQTINGKADETKQTSAFVAKYSADGKLLAVKTVYTAPNAEVAGTGLYFPESGDVYFRPKQMKVADGKLYVSAVYTGDVSMDNVAWGGRYVNIFDAMFSDLPSVGLFAMDAATLAGAQSVVLLQGTEKITTVQMMPEDICFTVDAGVVYVGFVANGKMKLTSKDGEQAIDMAYDEVGNYEHAFILSAIGANTQTSIHHVAAHDKSYGTDHISAMAVAGDKLYVGGTFYNELAFNKLKTSKGAADMFVACLNKDDMKVVWAGTDAYDEGDANNFDEVMTGLAVYNGNVFATGYAEQKDRTVTARLSFLFTATGTASAGDNGLIGALAYNGEMFAVNVVDRLDVNTAAYEFGTPSAIAFVDDTANVNGQVYTIDGKVLGRVPQASLRKGLYLVKKNGKVEKLWVR
ncbi:MAG: cadherin [Prevotellaceae bacterium]|nr:cadherin [Prevotellaceae bacterium]MDY6131184.1 cadherin [Prevotella sp.]